MGLLNIADKLSRLCEDLSQSLQKIKPLIADLRASK
ncbi:hypothetical protein SAMN05421736_1407, partial [Evansella caseinilytica]